MSKTICRPKIAVFGHKHIFRREGGIEVVVTELYPRMTDRIDIDIYDRVVPGEAQTEAPEIPGLTVKKSYTVNKSGLNAIIAAFVSAIRISFKHYDLVHIHAEGSGLVIPILKLFRKKVVVTIHGLDWQRGKWEGFAGRVIKKGEEYIGKYADRIIVLNEETQSYFRDVYGRVCDIIENGIRVKRTEDTHLLKEQYGLSDGDYFLYIGRFAPEKRIDLLVDAYNGMQTDTNLVLAGPYADLNRSADWYEKALQNKNIIFTGPVDGQLLEELYCGCKAFVLPSDLEGMSLSLLEAMGAGVKCVASDILENRVTLNGFGETFRAGDAEDLRRILEKIDAEEVKPNEEQIAYVKKEHDWDTVAKKTLALYDELIDQTGTKA